MFIGSCGQTENFFSSSWGWVLTCLLSSRPVLGPVGGIGKPIGPVLVRSSLVWPEDGLLEPWNKRGGGGRGPQKRGWLSLQTIP